jgi:hypothetical protein
MTLPASAGPSVSRRSGIPDRPVLIAGGGPVGLALAVELGLRGVECVVLEPRPQPTRLRPRAKTLNARTMEHARRWGLAGRLRAAAPLPVSWSQDVSFCTSFLGREITRFTGVLGLVDDARAHRPAAVGRRGARDAGGRVIAPGKRADLVLIDDDPVQDISAVGRIAAVWCGGVPVDGAAVADLPRR